MRTFSSFFGGATHPSHLLHEVRAPHSGEVVGTVHMATAAHVEAAIAAGKTARAAMAALPAYERRAILRKVEAGLRAREDEFAAVLAAEAGKPIDLARSEVRRAQDTFGFAAEEVSRPEGELLDLGIAPHGSGRWGLVRRVPVGLVSAITPFNFPLNLVAHKVAPAIAAGCPIVVKPAPQAPLSAFLLAWLCAEAGVPAGGIGVVLARVEDADPLVTDPRIQLLSFTGSARVGWHLKARAGHKRVALELGGNAAAIVHDDADLDEAARRIAVSAFAYAGQTCISAQRVLVHATVFDGFVERLVDETANRIVCGDPSHPGVVCGPLIDEATAHRVEAWIAEATQAGARVLRGGGRGGCFVEPSVLVDVPHHARLWCEEVFGPVVCVEPYADLAEAIAKVNDSRYGLQAGVFTRSIDVVWACFEGLEVGAVIHGDAPTFRVDAMPYGGVKESGLGREGLREAIREMTEPRLLVLRPRG